jgi:hypothetical protein
MAEQPVAIEITEFPKMDTGAPCPLVLADEYRVVLSYYLREFPDGHLSTVVSFESARTHSLGGPSEETLHGHPLWDNGLRHYGAFRIENSPLIQYLQRIDSVHPHHNPEVFKSLNHYILPMHDTTFECVARSFVITTSEADSDEDRSTRMIEALNAKHTVFDPPFWKASKNA